ncbi:hypothetical protein P4489_18635 [Heyndrickxia sporothermodurans]|uniref:hypothetical protein n=1 Tax=Heyndrickxia sporothermodurans TaxID=46224 RepID=UPI002E1A9044|nr:hypothetical protein [Heyndrickxia sporothermodurans]
MKKSSLIYLLLGIFSWIFVVSGVFKWLGVPSFDKLFTNIFGGRNFVNNILIILISCIVVATVIWGIKKLNKKIA